MTSRRAEAWFQAARAGLLCLRPSAGVAGFGFHTMSPRPGDEILANTVETMRSQRAPRNWKAAVVIAAVLTIVIKTPRFLTLH